MNVEIQVDLHYGVGDLVSKIESGLRLAGKQMDSLTVDDLAPVDEFHTRGREATLELTQFLQPSPSDRVIDVGCGLGGSGRHLAETYGCHVTGIDLTAEYLQVGAYLTNLVGLKDKVTLVEGSALEIPFEDNSFEVAWTEHVQMNIADKERFYSEIARVLKPGGKLLFHDIFRGGGDPPVYPVPWAEDDSLSFLVTEEEAKQLLQKAGLRICEWAGKTDETLEYFQKLSERIETQGPPPVSIHLLMKDNASDKLQNYVKNISEDRLSVSLGMAEKEILDFR